MKNDDRKRKSIRLKGHDYRDGGMYFVTVCTKNKERILGEVRNGKMVPNEWGEIVRNCIEELPNHFDGVQINTYVVMPNHFHILLYLDDQSRRGLACQAPTERHFAKPLAGSLSTIIGSLKSAATKHINQLRDAPGEHIWQRNYYEHIIRDEEETFRIRRYIIDNPTNWNNDPENA